MIGAIRRDENRNATHAACTDMLNRSPTLTNIAPTPALVYQDGAGPRFINPIRPDLQLAPGPNLC
jgi:hypothetical protein